MVTDVMDRQLPAPNNGLGTPFELRASSASTPRWTPAITASVDGLLSLHDDTIVLVLHAIETGDDAAWADLYARFAPLVRHWLGAASTDERVNASFARFWHALTTGTTDRVAHFDSLAAALRYLKLCTRSVQCDEARRRNAQPPPFAEDALLGLPAPDADVAEDLAARSEAEQLWDDVRACVTDPREREVVYRSYVLDQSPRAICAAAPERFPDVRGVYRLKRNALDRLRHALRRGAYCTSSP